MLDSESAVIEPEMDSFSHRNDSNGPYTFHGVSWTNHGQIEYDIQSQERKSKLLWRFGDDIADKRLYDYYRLMFPVNHVSIIVKATNKMLSSKGEKAINAKELHKWLGIRLAMAIGGRRMALDDYWSDSAIGLVSILQPPCYRQRFGMTKTRFKAIQTNLRLCEYEDND